MLHIWLQSPHSPLLLWQEGQQAWQAFAGWNKLREIIAPQSVCLYFPSSHIQQINTDLSPPQLKQLGDSGKQYLFEEVSLTPVEQLRVRDLPAADGVQLVAMAQNDIDSWQQSALLSDFTITALLPDFLLLPLPAAAVDQQVTLYQDTQTILIRQSEYQGMAISYLPLVIEQWPQLHEIGVVAPIEMLEATAIEPAISGDVDVRVDAQSQGAAMSSSAIKDRLRQYVSEEVVLTELRATPSPVKAPERHALNFFDKPSNSKLSPYLKLTILVALMAGVIQLSADALQGYQYRQAKAATSRMISAQYNAWFPDEPLSPTNTLQVQLQPKLATGSATESAQLAMLSRVAPLIKQSSLVAQSLVLAPDNLSFSVVGDNRASLDEFTDTLTAQGIQANLGRINSTDQQSVTAQVTITLKPASSS